MRRPSSAGRVALPGTRVSDCLDGVEPPLGERVVGILDGHLEQSDGRLEPERVVARGLSLPRGLIEGVDCRRMKLEVDVGVRESELGLGGERIPAELHRLGRCVLRLGERRPELAELDERQGVIELALHRLYLLAVGRRPGAVGRRHRARADLGWGEPARGAHRVPDHRAVGLGHRADQAIELSEPAVEALVSRAEGRGGARAVVVGFALFDAERAPARGPVLERRLHARPDLLAAFAEPPERGGERLTALRSEDRVYPPGLLSARARRGAVAPTDDARDHQE